MNALDAAADAAGAVDGLLARRRANAGAASVLFHQRPIEMARGRGT